MDHLDDITVGELRRAMEEVGEKKPTQRLLAAIAYKNGVTQTELAAWYGVQRRTIYNWLKRLEERPLSDAVTDADRPGRPRKLSAEEWERLKRTLDEPPTGMGYDASAWTPALVRRFVDERFDVDYSIPSCRRLLKEAGLRYRRAERPVAGDESDGSDALDDRGREWVPR